MYKLISHPDGEVVLADHSTNWRKERTRLLDNGADSVTTLKLDDIGMVVEMSHSHIDKKGVVCINQMLVKRGK